MIRRSIAAAGLLLLLAGAAAQAGARKVKVQVRDPVYGMVAGTLEIPANWKFAGTVARGGGCASTGPSLKYTAQSQDGLTALEAYPGSSWSWSDDASFNRSATRLGCPLSKAMSAAAFLRETVLPNLRPDAQLIAIDPPKAKWQARIDQRLANLNASSQQISGMVRGYKAQNRVDGALARIHASFHGAPVDEEISTLIQCTITQTNGGYPPHQVEKRQCRALYVGVRRTPPGEMDKQRDALEAIVETYKADPAWTERMTEDAEKAAQASINSTNAMTQQIVRNGEAQRASQQRIHDQQMAVTQRGTDLAMQRDREAQAATDTAAKRQAQVSLGRQTYVDPNTGQKIETTDQYGHVFRSGDGSTVLHTNDPTYDPNGRDNQIWTELTPTNP